MNENEKTVRTKQDAKAGMSQLYEIGEMIVSQEAIENAVEY